MKFLILFFTLMLQHYRSINRTTTISRSFSKWYQLFQTREWFIKLGRNGRYFLVVVIPSLLVGGTFILVEDMFWGLPAIVLEILLLLYILSHADFERHVTQYKDDLASGDVQGAYHCAEQFLSVPEIELSEELAQMHDQVCHTILHRWFEFFFLMVFWFLILGVPGLLLTWFSLQYSQLVHCAEKAWRPLHWLEWLPARFLGLTFALAGNFVRAIGIWKKSLWKMRTPAGDVLYSIALASLSNRDGEGQELKNAEIDSKIACDQMMELQNLHRRSAAIWLGIVALITIVGGAVF
jgi:AmpE protein